MFTQLQPILRVVDVKAEQAFYVRLGFTTFYESAGFVAMSVGDRILFGLQHSNEADASAFESQMTWQVGVDSVREVARLCELERFPIDTPPTLQSWGEWLLAVRSPGGYRIAFEGAE